MHGENPVENKPYKKGNEHMPKSMDSKNVKTKTPAPPLAVVKVEVEFVFERCGAEQVYICGDFNNWQPTSLRMIGNPEAGLWEKRLMLDPGRYEYKFFVDGNWIHDPDAGENVSNTYGSLNSVVEV